MATRITQTRREFMRRGAGIVAALHAPWLNAAAAQPAPPGADARFHRVSLMCENVDAMESFYGTVLGLPVTRSDESLVIRAGASELVFRADEKGRSPFYHFAFNIPENRLDSAIAWMNGRAPLIYHAPSQGHVLHFKRWDAHAVYFYDPGGNIVEFIARHTLNNARSAPFGMDQILCVSEVGLVTEDVPALGEAITRATGCSPYHGGSPVFAALGDENGLFILAREGRVWLPTRDRHAARHPVEVELSDPLTVGVTVDGIFRIQ